MDRHTSMMFTAMKLAVGTCPPDGNLTICAQDYFVTSRTLNAAEERVMSLCFFGAMYEDQIKYRKSF